jgi:hypothetical protein
MPRRARVTSRLAAVTFVGGAPLTGWAPMAAAISTIHVATSELILALRTLVS